jgi:hypothetical protein
MMVTKAIARLALASALAALSLPAQAAPYLFTYTGSVFDSGGVPGVSNGDVITIDVIMDNGGASTVSQVWGTGATVSAVVSVGSYTANFIDNFFSAAGFTTDAAGALIVTNWFGTLDSATATDSLGGAGGVRLFNGDVRTSLGSFIGYAPTLGIVAAWSGPVAVETPVPAPPMLALFGLGLTVAALSRRRRAA